MSAIAKANQYLYSNCRYAFIQPLSQDLNAFLGQNPNVEIVLVGLTEQNGQKYNAIQIQGKIDI